MDRVDSNGTYVQQLEARIVTFEEVNAQAWNELGDQDKVIDYLEKEVIKLRKMVIDLVEGYVTNT